ncbi:hypothetical protein HPP92_025630 [Vanilla planifolia]|uniref:t-SNARE coiled-coil homology domain-containing protein n=1 Tax=Vanilla planifolia TaxID=51239 RepID=A0A835PI83_VANPL|nr:hypothetical protein HPP92_025630 [Vanilla planifolia]
MDFDFSSISLELADVEGRVTDILRALSNGFQKLDRVKDPSRRSRQLEELTDQMRECKRLIKQFERATKEEEARITPETHKLLNEKKYSMIKELNSYVALKKKVNIILDIQTTERYASNFDNKQFDLFDALRSDGFNEENVLLASKANNEQLMERGHEMMDETDHAIDRAKKIVGETINVGADTTAALKEQTEQMSRIVNEIDTINFSIKKASEVAKEISRQVATDRCILAMLFLIVLGVIVIVIIKVVNPSNKDISDIPGLAPPVNRKLLSKT